MCSNYIHLYFGLWSMVIYEGKWILLALSQANAITVSHTDAVCHHCRLPRASQIDFCRYYTAFCFFIFGIIDRFSVLSSSRRSPDQASKQRHPAAMYIHPAQESKRCKKTTTPCSAYTQSFTHSQAKLQPTERGFNIL